MSSKTSSRRSLPRIAAKRDWASRRRDGSTGSSRSSPSERAPERASTRKATGRTPRRRRHLEGEVVALRRLDREGAASAAGARPKLAERSACVSGSSIARRSSPASRSVGGVVDHHLDRRRVPFAQEARQVGADHQLLDRARLALGVARGELARPGRDPDLPGGERLGDAELDRRAPSGVGDQVRHPEGGLGEVRAALDRLGGADVDLVREHAGRLLEDAPGIARGRGVLSGDGDRTLVGCRLRCARPASSPPRPARPSSSFAAARPPGRRRRRGRSRRRRRRGRRAPR